jgi:simple sugar transport system ATP-binding protein
MNILAGLLRATSGTLEVFGTTRDFRRPADARACSIAMVHQHFTLVPAFTVAENLSLDAMAGRRLTPYSTDRVSQEAMLKAEQLGWKLDPHAVTGSLPVGMQQRIEIVKALATGARIVIFDEPTAVLSAHEIDDLFRVFRVLKQDGCTVVLIAHKLAEILAVADDITVLRRGKVVAVTAASHTNERQLASWMVGETVTGDKRSDVDQMQQGHGDEQAAVLKLESVTANGDRGEQVLSNVNLTVAAGEIFGIGGVDGNGQNELAEVLVGLRGIKSGAILWRAGKFEPGISPTVGYIPQDRRKDGLATKMSVQDNLLFQAVQSRSFMKGPFLAQGKLRAMAANLVTQFDIRSAGLATPVSSLSGGNQQKIVAARALYSEPELIVAVNPTRGLDIGAARYVHDQLTGACNRGAAVVVLSTDIDEIAAISHRTAIITRGSLQEYEIRGRSAEDIGLLLGGAINIENNMDSRV